MDKLIGKKLGRLVVIGDSGERGSNGGKIMICKCDCGSVFKTAKKNLLHSKTPTRSCGCLQKDKAKKQYRINIKSKQVESTDLNRISQKRPQSNNKSGVRGVFYDKHNEKWVATLTFRGKKYKKSFGSKKAAEKQRKYWEEKYFEPVVEKYNKTLA